MSEQAEQKYKWYETWPGEGHEDYCGWNGDVAFGRIFYENTGPARGQWRWAGGHDGRLKEIPTPHCGWAASAGKAAALVEQHYEAALAMNGLKGGKQ